MDRAAWFYGTCWGCRKFARPPFDFGGAWYQLGDRTAAPHRAPADPDAAPLDGDRPARRAPGAARPRPAGGARPAAGARHQGARPARQPDAVGAGLLLRSRRQHHRVQRRTPDRRADLRSRRPALPIHHGLHAGAAVGGVLRRRRFCRRLRVAPRADVQRRHDLAVRRSRQPAAVLPLLGPASPIGADYAPGARPAASPAASAWRCCIARWPSARWAWWRRRRRCARSAFPVLAGLLRWANRAGARRRAASPSPSSPSCCSARRAPIPITRRRGPATRACRPGCGTRWLGRGDRLVLPAAVAHRRRGGAVAARRRARRGHSVLRGDRRRQRRVVPDAAAHRVAGPRRRRAGHAGQRAVSLGHPIRQPGRGGDARVALSRQHRGAGARRAEGTTQPAAGRGNGGRAWWPCS